MDVDPAIERRVSALNAHRILHRAGDARETTRKRKERGPADTGPPEPSPER